MNDQGSEANARSSLEDLLKAMNKWPVKDASELEVDPSADPEPLSSSELNASLQTLLSEPDTSASDVGYSRNPVTVSSSTITDEQPVRLNSIDDDFFEMVSRVQSKRLNDQRCDPIILSDLTNHSKNITRQSDTIVCNPGGDGEAHSGRRRRLSALFGRVGKAARRQSLLMSASFFPSSTSTPRPQKQQELASDTPQFPRSCSATAPSAARLQRTASDMCARNVHENDAGAVGVASMQSKTSLTSSTVKNNSPEFRVPIAPPRNRNRRNRAVSLYSLNQKHGAEGMLDLIANLQGRRMEEQRAHLSVQPDTVSLSVASSDDLKDDEGSNVERSRSEDAGSLYEMVIRSQSDRLDEQRSELPRTIPAEDVSLIVMSMQKGRIETQRAALNSTSQS